MNAPETGAPAGFRRLDDFEAARSAWPRGRQPELIRAAAQRFRARFKAAGTVTGVRTVDLVSAAYPRSFAFHEAARGLSPYVTICNRLVLVRFTDLLGQPRLLAWEPTIPEGSAKAPFYAELIRFYGEFLSHRVFKTEFHTLAQALTKAGVRADDVDYVAFDHLHVQDVRGLMGTRDGRLKAVFPRAKMIVQAKELDTVHSPHPMQTAWYVPDSGEGVDPERFIRLDGDYELGAGIALVATPGHTDGNMSLVLNTSDGIWVSSENGVALDNWFPEHSRIPGIRGYRKHYRREVVLNSNTLEDPQDQYNSMLLERELADVSKKDPRFKQVLPSTELLPWARNWPCLPSLFQGGIQYGQL
ncbi:MAG TPA: hypothetical protein VM369_11765 [Candidatus Binatia bacterium]|nr:hypothetical protein [Candidatus Binatia bacterium]